MDVAEADAVYSERLYVYCQSVPLLCTACHVLEWTVHGVPWLAGTALSLLHLVAFSTAELDEKKERFELLFFLFACLCADGALIGLVKLMFRRSRPAYTLNQAIPLGAPIADHYSFPSGHCSRAAMLAVLAQQQPLLAPYALSQYAFVGLVGLSRVCLGRHYLSDVLAGSALGVIEGICFTWLSPTYQLCRVALGSVAVGQWTPGRWLFEVLETQK